MSNHNIGFLKTSIIGCVSNETNINKLNKAVKLECIYCTQQYSKIWAMRFHLRIHLEIRPYKCTLCDFKHWEKNTVKRNHFASAHSRTGVIAEVVTLPEVEKLMQNQVEKDVLEIQDNQLKRNRGEPVGEKKNPPREHDHPFRNDIKEQFTMYKNRSTSWEANKSTNAQTNNNINNIVQSNQPCLASKLSRTFHNQMNSTIQNLPVTLANQFEPNRPLFPNIPFQNQNQNIFTHTAGVGNSNVDRIDRNYQYNHQMNMNLAGHQNYMANQNMIPRTTSQSPPKGLVQSNDLSIEQLMSNDF